MADDPIRIRSSAEDEAALGTFDGAFSDSGEMSAAANQALDNVQLDALELTTSLTGILDPTPVSDSIGTAIALHRGDYTGAALSAISLIPYLGDAIGKPGKIARLLPRFEKNLAELSKLLPKMEKAGGEAAQLAKKIKGQLAEYAGKFCDLPGASKICAMLGKMKSEVDEAANSAPKQSAATKGVAPAKRESGSTILGHYPEYMEMADSLGHRRFDIPTDIWNKMSDAERWTSNQKFLDRTISNGNDILLSTPLNRVKPGSYFERELQYLSNKGYKPNADGTKLILGGN